MTEQTITIQFNVYEGDVKADPARHYHLPSETMRTGILETLHVNFVNGQWEVTNPEAKPEWNWVGRSEWQHHAILDYLRARLGIPKPGEETPDA